MIGCLAALVMASEASAGGLLPCNFFSGLFPVRGAVADVDTAPDLVTANFHSDDVSVLLGNGDGSFQVAFFTAGDSVNAVAAADLDGDTVPDLVTTNGVSDDVSFLINLCDPATMPAVSRLGTSLLALLLLAAGLLGLAVREGR